MSRTRNLAITEGCQRHITVNELIICSWTL